MTEKTSETSHEHPDDTVNLTELRRRFDWILKTAIPVVIVALFIQKSDGNSALETILLLAIMTISLLAIWSAFVKFKLRHRRHGHKLSWYFNNKWLPYFCALLGVAGSYVSTIEIDASESDFAVKSSPLEIAQDSDEIALRNTFAADGKRSTRITASVANKTARTVLADQGLLQIHLRRPVACLAAIPIYQIDDEISVRANSIDAKVTALRGPLGGFSVPAAGTAKFDCRDILLRIKFKASITLAPRESTQLIVELPKTMHAKLKEVSDPFPEHSMFSRSVGDTREIAINFDFSPEPRTYVQVTLGVAPTGSIDTWACVTREFGAGPVRASADQLAVCSS